VSAADTGPKPLVANPAGLIVGLVMAVASAIIPGLGGGPAAPAVEPPTTALTAEVAAPAAADVQVLLDQVVVAPEGPRTGYERDLFRHWIDADGDGCDTREEVLIEESVVPATSGAGCALTSGEWLSAYDAVTVTAPGGLDIDHVVPLGEAWDSGASAWDSVRRQDYANDLDDPEALIAVTATTNRSKGDQDPAEWKPPNVADWCQYALDWLTVKVAWGLSADQAEVEALREMLVTCDAGSP
jgi:hypothetical protein